MLTPAQQATLDDHLRNHLHETKWPRQEEFVAELTDHYTDSILARMQQGEPFESALTRVYDDFGQAKGLKEVELNYWRLYSHNFRRRLFGQMLSYIAFPRLFISLPLIGLLLILKTQFTLSTLVWFPILLIGSNFSFLVASVFKNRSHHLGLLQPVAQRAAYLFRQISGWMIYSLMVEGLINMLSIGKASPYIATFLYTFAVLARISYSDLTRPKTLKPQVFN